MIGPGGIEGIELYRKTNNLLAAHYRGRFIDL
jgi:hypothetical protein